jgi:hypothetical protein
VTDVFVDQLGLGSGRLHAGRFGNELGHRVFEFATKARADDGTRGSDETETISPRVLRVTGRSPERRVFSYRPP